jgi:transcriptional regulator with XRE-family HTH domain
MVLFRRLLGEVLRSQRMRQGRTLREVSADARVSLGYISEIERGQKEASSELLASLCAALDVPLSEVLSEVSDAVALEEAALAMQLEDVTLDTSSVQGSLRGSLQRGRTESGSRPGDVVASAA